MKHSLKAFVANFVFFFFFLMPIYILILLFLHRRLCLFKVVKAVHGKDFFIRCPENKRVEIKNNKKNIEKIY